MKILIVAATLALTTACCKSPVIYPKYYYGTKVYIASGFYSGVTGSISRYRHCPTIDPAGSYQDSICYTISIVTEMHTLLEIEINEKDLRQE